MKETAHDIAQTFPTLRETLGDRVPLSAYVLVETEDQWIVLTSREVTDDWQEPPLVDLLGFLTWHMPHASTPGDHPMNGNSDLGSSVSVAP